jgi:protein-disulfide isomerase
MSQPTKREQRAARRAARLDAERGDAARTRRRRSVVRLTVAVAIAAAVTAGGVAVSASGGAPAPSPATASLHDGISVRGGVLGDPDAPVTVTEFVDLQCPVCAAAARDELPGLIRERVRTGEVKLDARLLHFLGPDSVRAARVAAGAEQQDRLWPFLLAFYAAQGPENSGYVTDGFLRDVAATAGVDADAALAFANTGAAEARLALANRDAGRLRVEGTPSFAVARGNGPERLVPADGLDAALDR